MSREGSDFSYKPKRGTVKAEAEGKRRERSQRTSRVDYTEVHTLSEMDSEGTVDSTEVSPTLVKFEREDSVHLAEFNGVDNLWTPETLRTRASKLTQQVGRLARASREETMAR